MITCYFTGSKFYEERSQKLKKFILILLLLLCPFTFVNAFQNEPDGFCLLKWGMTPQDIEKIYPIEYTEHTFDNHDCYNVSIPDAYGQMGVYGGTEVVCDFVDNRLVQITIDLPSLDNASDDDIRYYISENLIKVYGTPYYPCTDYPDSYHSDNDDLYVNWYGDQTVIVFDSTDGWHIWLYYAPYYKAVWGSGDKYYSRNK